VRTSELAARLDARGPRFGFVCPPPADPGWYRLADIDAAMIGSWLDELPAAQAGLRNVAAAGTALRLANCIVRPMMATLHIERQFPDSTPADVYVERLGGGFGRLALRATPLLPGQPELAAERLYGLFLPVLRAIRVDGKYGMRGLWGGVLDMIGAASLLVARTAGLPQRDVWATTERLLDGIATRAHCKGRPQPFSVCYSGGEAMFTVKSTCCLRYREHGLRAGEQPDNNEAYCHTCPFADDELRRRHYAEQMERR
jgi:hypothetical protein